MVYTLTTQQKKIENRPFAHQIRPQYRKAKFDFLGKVNKEKLRKTTAITP